MNYDRQTINLVFEIKRTLPEDLKKDFKLSSPDLVERIREIHQSTQRSATKSLAERFFEISGESLEKHKEGLSLAGSKTLSAATNLYRSVTHSSAVTQVKKAKIYRGRVVE